MALFANFCNICYNVDNASLKDISEENMKHLSDTLITFVGHADIIKRNEIYLCQLCCEELTRFDKFRDMCFSNLIQLRQRYINMKLDLQDDDACAVQNTLQQFVYEEVLRNSTLEKSNCPVSISTEYHEIIKSPGDLNNDCLVFNSQVTNLQLERNEYKIVGACSDVSGINSVTECDESRITVTNEEDMKNDILRHSENTKLEKFQAEADKDFDVPDTNIDSESDFTQMEFIKEEFDSKNEGESSDSENFALTNFVNESDKHANIDVKVPIVNNSEGNVNSENESTKEELHIKQETSSESLKLETVEDEFGEAVGGRSAIIMHADTIKHKQHLDVAASTSQVTIFFKAPSYGSTEKRLAIMEESIEGETPQILSHHLFRVINENNLNSKIIALSADNTNTNFGGLKLEDKLTAATIDGQFNHEHVQEYRNRSPEPRQSGTHSRVYPSVEAHTCAVCNKSFRTNTCLTRHARMHNDDRRYKCTVCNKPFAHLGNLTAHERIHSGTRPYKCTVCNKTFTLSSNLTKHERIHTGDRPYKCSVCNKTFTQLGSLTSHGRIHNGARPYKCSVCIKTFTHSGNLTIHERIHSGVRPYKCTVCNKTFTHQSNLTTHERIHSGARPYKCTICNKSYTRPGNLTTHERIHSDAMPYKCSGCNMTFTHLGNLTAHELIHTDD